MLESPKGKFLRSFGDRAFRVAAPKLWNELPKHIRDISSIIVFKTALKTHIFKLVFDVYFNNRVCTLLSTTFLIHCDLILHISYTDFVAFLIILCKKRFINC